MNFMITCTRKIEFDTAHRVKDHKSVCKMLHGHRYTLEATFSAPKLDELGMVIDFYDIKELLGTWIYDNWDHNTILNIADKELGDSIEKYTGQKIFYMDCNPTVENMVDHLLTKVCPELFADHPAKCVEIKIHETPKCAASAMAE